MFVYCREFYEPGAVMLEDEGAVIAGLLVGLNVIDCNLGIKDEDLDQPVRHSANHSLSYICHSQSQPLLYMAHPSTKFHQSQPLYYMSSQIIISLTHGSTNCHQLQSL